MFAKLSALALFLASTAAQTITVPDQASWGTVISVKFDGLTIDNISPTVDLLLTGVDIQKTYLIGSQVRVYNSDINVLLPYVVDQGVQYQIVATTINSNRGEYARSNPFIITF